MTEQHSAERHATPWIDPSYAPAPLRLSGSLTADICIVGAGITGLSCAYEALQSGSSVVVLDDGPVGGGQTHRTTAHLTTALDPRYAELERIHGAQIAQLVATSHVDAIHRIEALARSQHMDCDFERLEGYLFADKPEDDQVLRHEFSAATRAGLSDVGWAEHWPLSLWTDRPALRFGNQAQIHPLRYLAGLERMVLAEGGQIFSGEHVVQVVGGHSAYVATASGHRVYAGSIVVATHSPVNDTFVVHTKQAAYQTYVVGLRVDAESVPRALYWDTASPYHYARLTQLPTGEELLIVGGEDHKTGQAHDAERRYAALLEWGRSKFPAAREEALRWSGQVWEPVDGLPFIGRNPADSDNVFIATGYSGQGMTYGTTAGKLIADLIAERPNPLEEAFDPARRTLTTVLKYAAENLNTASQYTQWLTPGDNVPGAESLARGEGAVIGNGPAKTAAFRNADGELHQFSPVCPHLGGIVSWNADEQTWDCPCHGSRFAADGSVICGPANTGLRELPTPAAAVQAP